MNAQATLSEKGRVVISERRSGGAWFRRGRETGVHLFGKATMNLRIDARGHAVATGAQTAIAGNDLYVTLCRRHSSTALATRVNRTDLA